MFGGKWGIGTSKESSFVKREILIHPLHIP